MVGRKVAVTGGVACGKSTVCQMFRNLGALVVSADQIVHQLLSHDHEVKSQVIELLGKSALKDGVLSRDQIADTVFNDPQKLKGLEEILFPRVFEEIDRAYEQSNAPLFIAEVPLLFEAGGETRFDETVVVIADPSVAAKRNPSFAKRQSLLMANELKAKKASFIISNNGTLQELENEVKTYYQSILQGD